MSEPAETIWVDVTGLRDKHGGLRRFVKTLHVEGPGLGLAIKVNIEVAGRLDTPKPPESCFSTEFRAWLRDFAVE